MALYIVVGKAPARPAVWGVFVEQDEAGDFKPVEIEVVKTIDGYTVIKGLPEGTRIVTYGAFFVQSELAKSGFSADNH